MNYSINVKKISIILIIIYLVIGVGFYFVGGEQLQIGKSDASLSYGKADSTVGQILKDTKIEQDFSVSADMISQISIRTATYARVNSGNLFIKLIDKEDSSVLFSETVPLSILKDNLDFNLDIKDKITGVSNKELALLITSDVDNVDNAVTLYSGTKSDDSTLYINDTMTNNTLVFSVQCVKTLWFGQYYWYIFSMILILLIAYLINIYVKQKKNYSSIGVKVLVTFKKYKFLMEQLVAKDFKTKYKRSVLGILWSFLNPLLTMIVQYIVFSTIFKSDIPNFPVYLLSGIVVFNFFTESCGMGLMSIVGNASLITKVYVPKYIYPVSRVFSSVINLLLSLIPLLIVMILTKTKINISITLVPFALVCTLIFCIGMAFILSSAMVFFRDTQFLWNIAVMLWMYATPLFYPENIIPEKFSFIFKLNPLYHFIRFIRICILNGVSPEPIVYLYCIIFSVGTLLIGAIVFKKTQDKFVLNI
ncbi:ABC transporter permease [uncultured Clostridium sp.]|uniref:ABC transporter permease n=1 Tax=uncultured Clostridium sp. TaxID=59620 RepID=UPI0028EC7A1A|nr:ABC transporter permease [uncultured Clostridium sp.]